MKKLIDKILCKLGEHSWAWSGQERECVICGERQVFVIDKWISRRKTLNAIRRMPIRTADEEIQRLSRGKE